VWDANGSAAHPHAVLTGDTLFIGDVGRPDLMASVGVTADELAGKLYDSLHDKLLRLPDETLVYPAHGAGSMCGKNLSRETSSSLGQQRRYNYALQPMARADFIQLVTSDQPEAPAYFSHDAMLNRQERPLLAETLQKVLSPLSLTEVLAQGAAGAQVLDVRDPTEWAGAHLPGSINIGLGGQFATWSGTLLDHDIPIVIIAEPGRETEAATRLGRIGFDHVLGYLDGGMQALEGMPDRVQALERWTAVALSEGLESPDAPVVLDVRNDGERRTKHIAGSLHIPLAKLESRLAEVPRRRPVVVYCGSGYRSMMAASILERDGYEAVSDLVGGISAWEKSALPVTAEPADAGPIRALWNRCLQADRSLLSMSASVQPRARAALHARLLPRAAARGRDCYCTFRSRLGARHPARRRSRRVAWSEGTWQSRSVASPSSVPTAPWCQSGGTSRNVEAGVLRRAQPRQSRCRDREGGGASALGAVGALHDRRVVRQSAGHPARLRLDLRSAR
jgi:rhodanese-related sulfurtransferase